MVAYSRDERYIVGSDGTEVAFSHSKRVDSESISDQMVDKSSKIVNKLEKYNTKTLSDKSIKNLEQLGYI